MKFTQDEKTVLLQALDDFAENLKDDFDEDEFARRDFDIARELYQKVFIDKVSWEE